MQNGLNVTIQLYFHTNILEWNSNLNINDHKKKEAEVVQVFH